MGLLQTFGRTESVRDRESAMRVLGGLNGNGAKYLDR
jgi:hypothetical protein